MFMSLLQNFTTVARTVQSIAQGHSSGLTTALLAEQTRMLSWGDSNVLIQQAQQPAVPGGMALPPIPFENVMSCSPGTGFGAGGGTTSLTLPLGPNTFVNQPGQAGMNPMGIPMPTDQAGGGHVDASVVDLVTRSLRSAPPDMGPTLSFMAQGMSNDQIDNLKNE